MSKSLKELQKLVDEVSADNPSLREPEDRFTFWFLVAYIGEDPAKALAAITNGKDDLGLDAVFVDDLSRRIYLVQTKYAYSPEKRVEKKEDVVSFTRTARYLATEKEESFKSWIRDGHDGVRNLLVEARGKILNDNYEVALYFVTLGTIPDSVSHQAELDVKGSDRKIILDLLDWTRVQHMVDDYVEGVAPPIPATELELEMSEGVAVEQPLTRTEKDKEKGIGSYVFTMRVDKLAKVIESTSSRIFARNIRGFLGPRGQVNARVAETLEKNPRHFFLYNNGVTIVCDRAHLGGDGPRKVLTVSNPQIINGQQTARMISEHGQNVVDAAVLIKVIVVPRAIGHDQFSALVDKIVESTNNQNSIKPSDLVSNRPIHVRLALKLRREGYFYVRKRASKEEIRSIAGHKKWVIVQKHDLALAVAGCELDPHVPRNGKEHLFSNEENMSKVFSSEDPEYYLARYWLRKTVKTVSRKRKWWHYSEWLALHFSWSILGSRLRSTSECRKFRKAIEKEGENVTILRNLQSMIEHVFEAVDGFVVAQGGSREDTFFFKDRKGLHVSFQSYWKDHCGEAHANVDKLAHRSLPKPD